MRRNGVNRKNAMAFPLLDGKNPLDWNFLIVNYRTSLRFNTPNPDKPELKIED
jgi:hypothetical protein